MAFYSKLTRILAKHVLGWREYNAVRPVLSDGDMAPQQCSSTGEDLVTVASLPLPAGAATEATLGNIYARQADGAQKSVLRGAAKGATVAADATTTAVDANHQAIDAVVLSSVLPTGAATSTIQTDGTQKSIARGGAKGTTTAADVTSSVIDANHQGLDVTNVYADQTPVRIANWSSFVGDTTDPSSFTSVSPIYGDVRLQFSGITFGGTTPANYVQVTLWGRSGGVGGRVVKVGNTMTLTQADFTAGTFATTLTRMQFHANCSELAVTCAFLDGTSPTISGEVWAKNVPTGSLQVSDFERNSAGWPTLRIIGLDDLTGAIRVAVQSALYPPLDEILIINDTSKTTAGSPYYGPSSDGVVVDGYDIITFDISLTGATTSVGTITLEGTIDGTTWRDITLTAFDATTRTWVSGPAVSTAGGNLSLAWSVSVANWSKVRVKLAVSGATTGAYTVSMRRAKAGGMET